MTSSASRRPIAAGTGAGWPRLARDAVVDDVVAAATAPGRVGALVTGPAGSGRTTIAQQSAQRLAELLSGPTATVRGSRAMADLAFAALQPLLPRHLLTGGDDMPSLLAVTRSLGAALAEADGTAVVVVDDVGHVDDHSALVLSVLAQGGSARLVAVGTSPVDAPPAVVDLWRDDLVGSVPVPALTSEEVDELAVRFLGGELSLPSLRFVAEVSGGSPLLVRHLLEEGLGARTLQAVDDVWTFHDRAGSEPGGLAGLTGGDLVAARLARWSGAEREALELVALTGQLPLDLVERVADGEALDRLEREGVVVVEAAVPGAPPIVRVANEVMAEAVRRQVAFGRRRQLLRRVQGTGWGGRDQPLEQAMALAVWTLDAGAPLEAELALRCARAALEAHDAGLALRLAATVVDGPLLPEGAVVRAAALRSLGLTSQAAAVLDDARATDWRTMTPDQRAAWAAERTAVAVFTSDDDIAGTVGLVDQLREELLAQGTRPDLAGSLTQRRFVLMWAAGRHAELQAELAPLHARGAAELGVRVWSPLTALLAVCRAELGRHDQALALLAELDDTDIETPLPEAASRPVNVGTNVVRQRCGRWREAVGVVESLAVDAHRGLQDGGAWDTSVGVLHVLRGDLGNARRHLTSAHAQARLRDPYRCLPQIQSALALLDVLDGEPARARARLALPETSAWSPFNYRFTAQLCRDAARLALGEDVAADVLARAADLWADDRPAEAVQVAARVARSGHGPAVQFLLDHLLPEPGPLALALTSWAEATSAHDADGLATAARLLLDVGDLGFAAEAAQESITLSRGDRGRGQEARRVLSAVRSELARAAPAAQPLGDGLTKREREVAELASQRLSNAEIAERLVLSVRTVEGYLQGAFAKLGISSRTELRHALG